MQIIVVALGEKIRNRNRTQTITVITYPFRNQPPVKICTDSQPDCRPNRFGKTAEQRHSGQTHQKIGAHIRCFGTHSGNQRTKLSSAQIEIFGRTIFPGKAQPQENHSSQVHQNRCHYKIVIDTHMLDPSLLDGGIIASPEIDCNTEYSPYFS